jgi:hypothetical protein
MDGEVLIIPKLKMPVVHELPPASAGGKKNTSKQF